MSMHVWIDADSCPRTVRDYIVRYTGKTGIPVFFVANRDIPVDVPSPFFSMIVCGGSPGAADDYIADHAKKNDIVITRDIPLAARLIELDIKVLNDRGTIFSRENISKRLSERNYNLQLVQMGVVGDKSQTYGKKEFTFFANCFDREFQRMLKVSL